MANCHKIIEVHGTHALYHDYVFCSMYAIDTYYDKLGNLKLNIMVE